VEVVFSANLSKYAFNPPYGWGVGIKAMITIIDIGAIEGLGGVSF